MLEKKLQAKIDRQKELNGIDVHKLRPGTKIEVQTKNSLYCMEILQEPGCVAVKGGPHFPELEPAEFDGSNWGGSMLKVGWIGYEMQMELRTTKKKVVTTPVQAAKVIGEGWEYAMDWPRPGAGRQ